MSKKKSEEQTDDENQVVHNITDEKEIDVGKGLAKTVSSPEKTVSKFLPKKSTMDTHSSRIHQPMTLRSQNMVHHALTAIVDSPRIPTHFWDAWNHTDPQEQQKWRQSIEAELKQMLAMGVWTELDEADVPKDRKKLVPAGSSL